jgi:GH35 family endo-1,4-beta-xylanase
MHRRIRRIRVYGLVLCLLCAGGWAAASDNLLSQGAFRPTRHDNPVGWKVKAWHNKLVNVVSEAAASYLRIVQPNEGGYCIIETTLPLDPTWSKLRFSVESRVQDLVQGDPGWKMSRIEPVFKGRSSHKPGVIHCHESEQWTEHTAEWNVPDGATELVLMVGFWESSGTFDLRDMKITVTGERQLTAEQRAAYEKLRLGERQPQVIPQGDYLATLKEEFSDIGPAYFVGGTTEAQVMERLQPGGQVSNAPLFKVQDQPFTLARRIHVPAKTKHPAMVNLRLFNTEPIHKGDTVLVTFWARGTKGRQKVDDGAGAVVQQLIKSHVGGPKHGHLTRYHDTKDLTEQWQRYWIATTEPSQWDFPAGKLELLMMLGHKPQDVQIGGLAWMIFPSGSNLANMPKKNWDYPGREPGAAWRAEAERRIDKLRKGRLTVKVVGADGKPLPGATVQVKLKRHAFNFSLATSPSLWAGADRFSDEDMRRHNQIVLDYFSGVGPTNALKWRHHGDGAKAQRTRQFLQWAKDQGLVTRGHVLVWPSIHHTPRQFKELAKTDPQKLRRIVREHVTDYVTRYRGLIDDWDVTNETDGNRDYMDLFGPEEIVQWYKLARAADPEVKLTFNEPSFGPGGMEGGSFPPELLGEYRGWVDYLIKQGAPLDRLGSQMHSGAVGKLRPGEHITAAWEQWDRMVELYDKDLIITELDVNIDDPHDPDQLAYQADVLRDTLILAFAHPRMVGVQQWGFWEGAHWLPNAALWRRDWSIKPNGEAYVDLITKTWHTDQQGRTDADGGFATRGFFGDYQVVVRHGDRSKTATVTFDKSNQSQPIVVSLE